MTPFKIEFDSYEGVLFEVYSTTQYMVGTSIKVRTSGSAEINMMHYPLQCHTRV